MFSRNTLDTHDQFTLGLTIFLALFLGDFLYLTWKNEDHTQAVVASQIQVATPRRAARPAAAPPATNPSMAIAAETSPNAESTDARDQGTQSSRDARDPRRTRGSKSSRGPSGPQGSGPSGSSKYGRSPSGSRDAYSSRDSSRGPSDRSRSSDSSRDSRRPDDRRDSQNSPSPSIDPRQPGEFDKASPDDQREQEIAERAREMAEQAFRERVADQPPIEAEMIVQPVDAGPFRDGPPDFEPSDGPEESPFPGNS